MRELLTRSTIWITIVTYTFGAVFFALKTQTRTLNLLTRGLWTTAVVALAAHFVCAFHFYHYWSQDSAYLETARQTEEVFRLNWGGGLFINYSVLAIWMVDVGWWWVKGLRSYRQRRPWFLVMIWHSFLIFILFNATVVFKDGIVRWIGLLICLTLILAWFSVNKHRTAALSVS